jgi:hypothetical protein
MDFIYVLTGELLHADTWGYFILNLKTNQHVLEKPDRQGSTVKNLSVPILLKDPLERSMLAYLSLVFIKLICAILCNTWK